MAGYAVAGRNPETVDPEEVNSWLEQANLMLRNITSDRLVLTTHLVRSNSDGSEYPEGEFRSEFARSLDRSYRDRMVDGRLYRNELFLWVMLRPAGVGLSDDLREMWARKTNPVVETPDERIDRLNDILLMIEADLKPYGLRRLGFRQEGRTLFTEIGEALKFVLTGRRSKVPLLNAGLDSSIYTDRAIFDRDTGRIWHPDSTTFVAGFRVKEYPARTWPGHFNILLAAPYCFVLTQTFAPLSKQGGLRRVNRKQNRLVGAGDKAFEQIAGLDQVANDLIDNKYVMGSHHLSLVVFADSRKALAAVAAQAHADMADSGAVAVREDLGLEACFWAQLPGNMRLRTSPGVISSRNFVGLSSLHNYPLGAPKGEWGAPIALLRTTGGTGFRFHFHVGGVGNIFITGPVGSGKTTLLLFLLTQAEKTGARIVFFDKDRGGEIAIRAIGGTYLVMPDGTPTGCAPLKAMTDSPADISFLAELIRGLICAGGEYEMTPEDDRRLMVGLRAVMKLPAASRSLRELRAFMGSTDPKGAAARLAKWCSDGDLGWVLDCDEDRIGLSAPALGFDMTSVLDNATVRGPLMAYLFHRVEALFDGSRVVLAIDEFWKSLLDEGFRDMVHDKLKTMRKRNVPLILSTQSPRDALNSKIAHTIIEQCPTQIHAPNPRADRRDYVEGLKLTEPELELIATGMSASSHSYLVRQGKESVVCELDLSGSLEHIAVLSGRATTIAQMDDLIRTHGEAEAGWIDRFMSSHRTKEPA